MAVRKNLNQKLHPIYGIQFIVPINSYLRCDLVEYKIFQTYYEGCPLLNEI